MTEEALGNLNDIASMENKTEDKTIHKPAELTIKHGLLSSHNVSETRAESSLLKSTERSGFQLDSAQTFSDMTPLLITPAPYTSVKTSNTASLHATTSNTDSVSEITPSVSCINVTLQNTTTPSTTNTNISPILPLPSISITSEPSTTIIPPSTTTLPPPTTTPTIMRGVTIGMLMKDGLMKTGARVLSFQTKGEEMVGDLLEGGVVCCVTTNTTHPSITAWMVACRRHLLLHPSLCPAESLRYKDRPLHTYQHSWYRRHRPFKRPPLKDITTESNDPEDMQNKHVMEMGHEDEDSKEEPCTPGMRWLQECAGQSDMMEEVIASRLGRRCLQGQSNFLVECGSFNNKRLQPFQVTISSSCLLLMHFHTHLFSCEVLGYMAGKWNSTNQHLTITEAYPCRCANNNDKQLTDLLEYELMVEMEERGEVLGGWYHSHNRCQSSPSLRDVELQMEHQFQLKGLESSSFQPCFSFIVSPFYTAGESSASDSKLIYVHPPPEQRALDYGTPMLVHYNIQQDDVISPTTLRKMRECVGEGGGEGKGGAWWVPGKFAPEERPIFMQRLKQAIINFCPGKKIDQSIEKVLSLI